jgi:hypothetical protein
MSLKKAVFFQGKRATISIDIFIAAVSSKE